MLKPFPGVGPDEDYYLTPGYVGVLEFTIPYTAIADVVDPHGPIDRLLYPSS